MNLLKGYYGGSKETTPAAPEYSPPVHEPTAEQLKNFDEFKKLVASDATLNPALYDEPTLLRFCRAKQYDVKKAFDTFVNFMKWKSSFVPMTEAEATSLIEAKQKGFILHPHNDKYGRPLFIMTPRFNNPSLKSSEDLIERSFVWILDDAISKMAPGVETFDLIINMNGFQWKHNDQQTMQKLLTVLQSYYVERLGEAFVVHQPWFFNAVWAIYKFFIDENTQKKIHMLGGDYKTQLLKIFDADKLPDEFGGTFPYHKPDVDAWDPDFIAQHTKKA